MVSARTLTVALLFTAIDVRALAASDAPSASPTDDEPATIVIYGDPPPPPRPAYDPWQPPPPVEPVRSDPSDAIAPPESPPDPDPAVRHWSIGAHLGAMFGSRSDELNAVISGVGARSRLDYSLDALTTGIECAYHGGGGVGPDGGRWPWSFHASLVTNLSEPFGTLLDRDWVTSGGRTVEFSHTDSRLTARMWLVDASLRLGLVGWRRRPSRIVLDAVIGYRHESFAFDGWGFTGWVLQSGQQLPQYLRPETRAIHFDAQHAMPNAGLAIHGHVTRRMLLDAEALAAFVVTVDADDHVLRGKRSTATTVGGGVIVRVAPRWIVYGAESGAATVSLGIDVGLRYLAAFGTLHQQFYVDDPSTARDERAAVIPDAAYAATSLIGWMRSTLDVAF